MANKASYDASRTASHKSVPAPLLFYIYICDLSTTVSRQYVYADDLAIMHADADLQVVERYRTRTWQL